MKTKQHNPLKILSLFVGMSIISLLLTLSSCDILNPCDSKQYGGGTTYDQSRVADLCSHNCDRNGKKYDKSEITGTDNNGDYLFNCYCCD